MEKHWIWFNMLNISIDIKANILKHYNIQDILNMKNKIIKQFDLSDNEILEFSNEKYLSLANNIIKYNKKNDIGILHILDDNYPLLLKQIYNPPIVLYYKGNIDLLRNKFVSIFIGQDIDVYGKKVLNELTENLYKDGINIVTKFEEYNKNIFMCNAKNENVLILSSGIKNHYYVDKAIMLTEYEPCINTSKRNIIKRNRIISGLTKESILIQTTIKDGASYMVDSILESNRELWVIPADITKSANYYTNELIKQGANVLTQYNNLWVYEQK